MTRLFILLYVGVLAVLFAAWYIHGEVTKRRAEADRARVFEEAHGGGARLVASELEVSASSTAENREQALARMRRRFAYPVDVIPLDQFPDSVRQQLASGDDVIYFSNGDDEEVVLASLAGGEEVVRLGPFPDYRGAAIERSLGGWMQLAADKLDEAEPDQRDTEFRNLQERFDFPIEIANREELPNGAKLRIAGGEKVVLYGSEPEPVERWFAATPLAGDASVIRFGPLPSFERIEQKAATTTLALVLLPAALAIALLLRPVARQLRRVENAAKAIAAGDLSARVDERRVGSAKPLAQAFNNMASRTETLVRTQRELLQAVSHELRTPLSRMRFAIDLVETAKDDDERRRRLDSIDVATDELNGLVDELLSYVRMETTEPHLDVEVIAVHETLEEMFPKYADMHPNVKFCFNDEAAKDETSVRADRRGLQRVLGNLLSNAGRFAKNKVQVSAAADATTTTIDVDDDGCGVPESDREHVIQPFTRLDNQQNGGGVGLGLALVKRIVTQHGGRVEVTTSPLGGCRVRTSWPHDHNNDPAPGNGWDSWTR